MLHFGLWGVSEKLASLDEGAPPHRTRPRRRRPRLLDDLRDLTALGGGPSGERFARAAIGGGDHIDAPAVRRLTAHGTPVVVVSRPESLAFVLRRAASQVIDLDTGGTAVPATVSRSVAFVVCESGPDRWRS